MISAILLAAGQSKRMIGENKLSKKILNTPLITLSTKNIIDSPVDELIIVLGYEKEIIKKLIYKNNKIKFVFNENYKSGIASSIKIGLENLSKDTKAFFICLADMPFINKNIYINIIKHLHTKEIIVPTYKGQQGNPILFSISMKNEIMNVKGDIGAKKILELNQDKILKLEIFEDCIIKDFNTLENFAI